VLVVVEQEKEEEILIKIKVEQEVLVDHSMIGLLLHQLAKMVIMLVAEEEPTKVVQILAPEV
jgi:hypothetical protein